MRHIVIPALLAGALVAVPAAARADDGYFGDGTKQLVFKEEGKRTKTQNITLLSLAGAAVLAGAVGSFYLLDARSQSDEVSASGLHTLLAWSPELEATRKDALRSNRIGTVSMGISGGFAAATIIAYIITQPDKEVGYQDWQTRNRLPSITPADGGLVIGQGWAF